MGKKRNLAGGGPRDSQQQPDQQEARTKYAIDEEFADSEDEFFAERDKILLEDGPANKRRKVDPTDEFLQPSDEEVLGYDDDGASEDDDPDNDSARVDDDESASNRGDQEEEFGENLRDWGTSKADYYNADVIETEADALEEEQEARRLHEEHLKTFTEADFGFDEDQWKQEDAAGQNRPTVTHTERLPELEVREDATSEEKAQILIKRYPEFEPLAKDFVVLQHVHRDLLLASKAAEAVVKVKGSSRNGYINGGTERLVRHETPLATTKLRALSAYLGTIGMYFALLTSTANSDSQALAMSPAQLRDHPVVQTLLRTRRLWEEIKEFAIPDLPEVVRAAEDAKGAEEDKAAQEMDGNRAGPSTNGDAIPKKKGRSKADRAAAKARRQAEAERQLRMQKTEVKLAELDNLLSSSRTATTTKKPPHKTILSRDDESDPGDEDALTAQETAEKVQRKKSLRFYTSQLAQKSNKRGAASRDTGGDADLPYKERLKDRQARLMREAEKRGGASAGQREQLNSDEDEAEDVHVAQQVRHDANDSDAAYYDFISTRTQQKKKKDNDRKQQLHARNITSYGSTPPNDGQQMAPPDGKRGISYTIAKNNSLRAPGKKQIRNPRVKKKLRYEQKVKKLATMRPMYRAGGEGRGGYGGELTGIKTNVIKGVKL